MEQSNVEELERHVERLKRSWGGPMTEKEISFLRDLQAFIEFSIRNGLGFPLTLGTIGHDVNNLLRGEQFYDPGNPTQPCFTPKVKGYAKIVQDLENVQKNPELQRELSQLD